MVGWKYRRSDSNREEYRDLEWIVWKCDMRTAPGKQVIALLWVIPAIISGLASRADSQEVVLESIIQVRAASVENQNLRYVVDLNFSSIPRHYWLYYSKTKKHVVIDIYGETLEVGENLRLPRNEVFSSMRTWSSHSEIALSNVRSQIILGADSGWSFSEQRISGKSIRVSAGRPVSAPQSPPPPKDPLVHFLVGSFAVVSAFFLTFGILQYIE